jgi:hypothetical protein
MGRRSVGSGVTLTSQFETDLRSFRFQDHKASLSQQRTSSAETKAAAWTEQRPKEPRSREDAAASCTSPMPADLGPALDPVPPPALSSRREPTRLRSPHTVDSSCPSVTIRCRRSARRPCPATYLDRMPFQVCPPQDERPFQLGRGLLKSTLTVIRFPAYDP